MQINFKKHTDLKDFSLDIICNQYVSVGSDWNYPDITSFFSRLYYIEEGCGSIYSNNKETLLIPGNVYFIPTGSCISYHGSDKTPMKKLFFHISLISPKEQHDIFSNIEKGVYFIPIEDITTHNVFDIYQRDDYTGLLFMQSIIYSTLMVLYNKYHWDTPQIKQHSKHVIKIMNYVQNHLSIQLTVKEIADALFLSEGTLSRTFKSEMGITVGKYIDTLIFTKANHLLLKKDYTIKDISRELGFCDQFYFSRRFKEKFGCSPQQYREVEVSF